MTSRSVLNLGTLLFGTTTTASGLLLQRRFHLQRAPRVPGPGFDYFVWSALHQWSSLALVALVGAHLWVNQKWIGSVLAKRLWNRHMQLVTLVGLFLVAAVTGFGAWTVGAIEATARREHGFVEVHDKVALLLAVFLVAHVWARRRRLVRSGAEGTRRPTQQPSRVGRMH